MSEHGSHRRHDDADDDDYKHRRDSNNTPPGGIPGVRYSEPFVPQYTSYPGYTSTSHSSNHAPPPLRDPPPPGSYQYSQLPYGVQYSAKPVIPVGSRYDDDGKPSKKKKDRLNQYREEEEYPERRRSRQPSPTSDGEFDDRRRSKKEKDGWSLSDLWRSKSPDSDDDPRQARKKDSNYDEREDWSNDGRRFDDRRGYPSDAPYPSDHGGFSTAAMPPPPPPPLDPYRDDRSHRGSIRDRDSPSPPGRSKSKSKRSSTSSSRLEARALSPDGLRPKLDRLSVGGLSAGSLSVGDTRSRSGSSAMPPPSPLLEAYRGTWQSMQRSPMAPARYFDDDDDLDAIEPLDGMESRHDRHGSGTFHPDSRETGVTLYRKDSRHRRDSSGSRSRGGGSPRRKDSTSSKKKSVSMYAADQDAREIAAQLLSRKEPDWRVITEILPTLSHDQILELHTAYKRVAKLNGKGINLAKHIKLKATGHYRTIAFVTALGRWESESYWANYWYQSNSSKRELLIESLMGRPNREIHMIKESFKDKRYNDDLLRCMDKELKADKFRTAILLALEERRQEESEPLSREDINRDVEAWARFLRRGGGESGLLEICINRSDRHLRECLRQFEKQESGNFAKLVLDRSANLVGEVIVHILNGVINRPARDAMLLHHALIDLKKKKGRSNSDSRDTSPRSSMSRLNPFSADSQSQKEAAREKAKEAQDRKERFELLISRLIRLHWDRTHMRYVKEEYRGKYGVEVEDDVEEFLKPGEFQEFCFGLLDTR